jgi:hypothetical protein
LLQTWGAQPVCDGVDQAVQLSCHLRELAFLDLTENLILSAQLIDLHLSSAHELLNELRRNQALPEAIEDDPF